MNQGDLMNMARMMAELCYMLHDKPIFTEQESEMMLDFWREHNNYPFSEHSSGREWE